MNERIEELMSIICEGENSIQREEVENYINNLQSKIDKAIEILNDGLKQLDERNRCEVYSEEYLENARDILKENK